MAATPSSWTHKKLIRNVLTDEATIVVNYEVVLLSTVMKEFNEVAKGSLSEEELSRAKNQLKASYQMSLETQSGIVEDIAAQASLKGSYSPLEDTLKQVDSVSKDDVVRFAKSVFSTRPSFVAQGDLSTTPRLDKLLAELSLK